MGRNEDLEIRRRSAVMTPPGTSVPVTREQQLEDLTELIELRQTFDPFSGAPEPDEGA